MRILAINPNTTQAITRLVETHVRLRLPAGAELECVSGRFGAAYVASRAAFAIAAHAALDAFAAHRDRCDGVLLACFGDPGLEALREIASVPVVALADASVRQAASVGRFGIVTGGERWGPMLAERVRDSGFEDRLARIRTVAPSGAAIAADPERALNVLADACSACAVEDGAETVILGGAGLAGLAARLRPRLDVPLICSLEAGVDALLQAVRDRAGPGASAAEGPEPVASVGLPAALAALLPG